MIPLSVPNFQGNELKYVTEAVREGWVSTGGSYIKKMEEQVSQFLKISHAAACQSGTAALHLSLLECGVQAGELVIAPTLTFIAAVNPIRYIGADPVFMDCDDSLCMDADKLGQFCEFECRLTQEGLKHIGTGKRIRAVVVVHVFGNLADMEAIMDVADKYRLKVVEDATEALGTRYRKGRFQDRFAGTIGDFGAYSFNGNKIITTGGGGMVVAKDPQKLAHIRYLSVQAKNDGGFYCHDEVGYNYRMTNVQAAIGVAQMEMLPEFIRRKNMNYDRYCSCLQTFERGELMRFREGTYANKWFYSLHLYERHPDRSKIICGFDEAGIQTRAIWGLIHMQKPYLRCITYQIEKAEYYSEHIINLPCSTNLQERQIVEICDYIKKNL